MNEPPSLLTVNSGSSSIRFAVYQASAPPRQLLRGMIEGLGSKRTTLTATGPGGATLPARRLTNGEPRAATHFFLDWLESQPAYASVQAVGHRLVCGTTHVEPVPITSALLKELRGLVPYSTDHLPRQLTLIDELSKRKPAWRQVACFDSAFHRTMPRVAKLLPIPRCYSDQGMERYGFHGLSYAYLMEELGRLDPAAAKGRVILAHLGSGASMAAVYRGKSVDTSMGFTSTSGLVMSTRSGDLDPGMAYYLARAEKMSAAQFQRMVTHESGLRGVSGTSGDMRDLLARETRDPNAADAVELFCYQAKKWIGAYAAVLGGIDTLVFAGGMGENAPVIRQRICAGLGFLGLEVDKRRNARSAPIISPTRGRVPIRVIHTDEDLMIARSVIRILGF